MKQIGIIMSKVYKAMNRRQLRGMLTALFAEGCDALIFTITEEFFDQNVKRGEQNLLRMINFDRLDGVIYLPYCFSDDCTMRAIEQTLAERCKKPVVCIGAGDQTAESRPYDAYVWFDDTAHFAQITSHLIRTHKCRNLLCLTGPAHMETSHRRANGFRQAISEAGLPMREDAVVYGDFWVEAAKTLAAEILSGAREMPDAVVCGNDSSAAALCDALTAGGIAVPEQIRITGYDSTEEANAHIPSLTTFAPDTEQLGSAAAARLLALIRHRKPDAGELTGGHLVCGESCGHPRQDYRVAGYDYERMEAGYVDTSLQTRLLSCENFSALIRSIYELTYTFTDSNYRSSAVYRLCLCTDWSELPPEGYTDAPESEEYTENMINTNFQNNEDIFPASLMIPPDLRRTEPSVYYFSAAHFRGHRFGWSIFRLNGFPDGYDVFYPRFCREVNRALAFLSLQNSYKSLAYRSFVAEKRDPLTGLYVFRRCPHLWEQTASMAALYGEQIYILVLELCGLRQIEETDSRLARDRCLLTFAEILQSIHSSKEIAFRISDDVFAVIGSEAAPAKRPAHLLKAAAELMQERTQLDAALRSDTILMRDTETHSFDAAQKAINSAVSELQHAAAASHANSPHWRAVHELRRLIYSEPEREWNIEACCRQMNMSRSYLQKIYSQTFGNTCAQDIQNAKLHHAKKLLLHTGLTLQDIAVRCGYDYSHFMRVFKKETGMTPTEYRSGNLK